ncbi:Electron transfer flavoprotein alpha subunit [Thermodesulfatator indicus DSM 15286]|uniref:Electron transfer flavoprotein alpha subunit n=1 Tax=Thermodesulfatator indicus (strain DSM 15286 / JCM 11887 / CIR29812) TaxID=667014 RepID=F8AAB8_THEID|nr:electron transfer flavoprotein subunit alpha/FixB family protein [Thermodesulfatator indicus]AEH44255.1 Electron transfer flavoprotein alpha subunit [Thermodesulfatator indicus DSM 15286]
MENYQGIAIFGEWTGIEIHESTYELLSEGRRLADELESSLNVLILGPPEAKEAAQELISYGADKVVATFDEKLKDFRDDIYAQVVAEMLKKYQPEIMLFPATSLGQALAPRVAGLLKLGLTAHCIAFEIRKEDRALIQIRPSFGEQIMARIVSRTKPQMATVRPGVFPHAQKIESHQGEFEIFEPSEKALVSALEVIEKKPKPKAEVDITKAKTIVAGGLGLGSKEYFQKLFELAELLDGAVGATRPVCHLGWVSEDHMIGVSGVNVRPKLYLGFGISGSLHHTVGLQGVETLVAINTDANAPLMKQADIAVQGDAKEILPLLIKKLKKLKSQREDD